jgi:hypothetical protein
MSIATASPHLDGFAVFATALRADTIFLAKKISSRTK